MKIVKKFNPIQRSYISKYHLDNLAMLPDHLMIPMHLLEWLVSKTSNDGSKYFQHENKSIHFNKEMVDKVSGFPGGTKQFLLESSDPEINREVDEICNQYLQGKKKISVLNVESVLLGSNNEVVFIRSFLLLFITTVLCPSTYNFVNPKYLFSLRDSDIKEVYNLDFASLCLNNLWNEMNSWKTKVLQDQSNSNKILWIGGCLPLIAVSAIFVFLYLLCNLFCFSIIFVNILL
jgi:hypothetical protein